MNICFVVTVPFALNAFLTEPIRQLAEQGWRVTVIVNQAAGNVEPTLVERTEIVHMDIQRQMAPASDIFTLLKLWLFFRARRFDIVHTITPKAGLLAMMAARLTCVPVRIHTFTGQVWATRRGPMRWLLKGMDQILSRCATALLADSPSQRDFLIAESVVLGERIEVLGRGSVCGVDTIRFSPDFNQRRQVRSGLGIPQEAMVYLYLGRLHREKGVLELASAFRRAATAVPNVCLLLVGPDEGGLTAEIKAAVGEAVSHLWIIGLTHQPERYMAAADVFCLPSYREGFGQVLMEAAAVGLPTIGTDIYGITDAILDGETGLLVPPRDVPALSDGMIRLATNPELRNQMGATGRKRAICSFSISAMVDEWLDYYARQQEAFHQSAEKPQGHLS